MRRWARKLGMVLMASGMGVAQKYVPPTPPLTVDPCAAVANPLLPKDPAAKVQPVCPPPAPVIAPSAPADGKTPASQFPFPGEAAPGAKPSEVNRFPYPGEKQATLSTAPAKAPGNAADQFPYPGETAKSPDAMPEGDTKRYVPDAPAPGGAGAPDNSSSSSSSSSSGAGSSADNSTSDPLPGSPGDAGSGTALGRAHGRRQLPKVSALSQEDRVSEDLDVAKFYSDRGNFQAAYLRAKDATKLMPDDAETHFALAQAAEKLKRKDEAAAEYALYLKLDPAGEKTTTAQRALSQLHLRDDK